MAEDSLSGIWTAVGTWLYTAFTLGLFIAAIVAAVYTKRSWDAAKLRERSAQASAIAAWLEDELDKDRAPTGKYLIVAGNPTGVPVYDLKWVVNGHGEIKIPYVVDNWTGVLIPHPRAVIGSMTWAAGDDIIEPSENPDEELLARLHNPGDFRVEIEFTDAAGVRWKREDDGRLHEAIA